MPIEIIVAVIGGTCVIVAAIIPFIFKHKSKKHTDPREKIIINNEYNVISPDMTSTQLTKSTNFINDNTPQTEGFLSGDRVYGTGDIEDLPIDSPEYLQAFAAQAEMLKNEKSILEVYMGGNKE